METGFGERRSAEAIGGILSIVRSFRSILMLFYFLFLINIYNTNQGSLSLVKAS